MILIRVLHILMVIHPRINARIFNVDSCIMIKKIVCIAAYSKSQLIVVFSRAKKFCRRKFIKKNREIKIKILHNIEFKIKIYLRIILIIYIVLGCFEKHYRD